MDYKIVLDSCGELTYKMKESGIYHTAVLSMLVDGDTILDDESFDRKDFLKRVAVSPECPKSSCPSPDAYMELYGGAEKRVYVVTLSAELSGSYNSAQLGKELWKEENEDGDKQIYVFNSRSASVGESLIALKIQECEEKGYSFEEVIAKMAEHIVADGKNTENKVLAIAHCNCPERAREIERMILDKIKVKDSFIVETGGISTMYANDGGIIVVL